MARIVLPLLFMACGGVPQGDSKPVAPQVADPAVSKAVPSSVPDGLAETRPAPSTCPEGMLPVPGGRFVMGQSGGEAGSDEHFVHLVMVDGFCMDKIHFSF